VTSTVILTGDINLMNVADAAVPFRRIADELRGADVLFGNLECCLHVPASARSISTEGFFADPEIGGQALRLAGIHAVGIANNVNYGAANIMASIARLDQLGILHTGAGANLAAARAPRSLRATGCESAFCSAARSIGRPITRRTRIHPALPSSRVTPRTMSPQAVCSPGSRPQIALACRR